MDSGWVLYVFGFILLVFLPPYILSIYWSGPGARLGTAITYPILYSLFLLIPTGLPKLSLWLVVWLIGPHVLLCTSLYFFGKEKIVKTKTKARAKEKQQLIDANRRESKVLLGEAFSPQTTLVLGLEPISAYELESQALKSVTKDSDRHDR
jgi:hypothetical protein